jgi:transposase
VEGVCQMFYGIDLSKESFKAGVLDVESEKLRIIHCGLQKELLEKFKQRLTKEDYVVVEASTNTFWFVDQIRELVKDCYVIDPWKFSIIYQSKKKTDRIDAEKLTRKLKYHVLYDQSPDEFPTVFIPSKEVQEIRSLFSTYDFLKKEKNMTKNRIRSLLNQNGIFGFKNKDISEKKVQTELLAQEMSDSLIFQVKMQFEVLDVQEKKLEETKGKILVKGKIFDREIELLTSIKGISPFIAIAVMSDVVDVHRFKNAKHFCSYLRAAPGIDASGDKTKIGKINKHSRNLTMGLLVESMNHFRNGSNKIEAFYQKKSKGKSKGKVRVAVIRKMLSYMYYMLTREQYYYYVDKTNHANKKAEYARVLKKIA